MDNSLGSVFKPDHPHQPVAALMLVENSQAMSHIWADLRDNHLKRLIDNIVLANPGAPITLSVLESYPCPNPGSNPSTSRQYSGYYGSLYDLAINTVPTNKITAERIGTCIDILESHRGQNQSTALHLVIVAISTPSEDPSLAFSGTSHVPWISLAHKMGERNIHCHIVVSSQQEMGKLTLLFEETGNIEQSLYTTQDPSQFVFRLSARPFHDPYVDNRPTSLPGGRIMPPRRNSYPLDNFYPEATQEHSSAAAPAEGDEAPRLVHQLQQVHGLTKKKVYGTKPARQPFFKEERVQHKYRPPPAPLTMPMTMVDQSMPSPTAGGRALSQSRADRLSRLSQASPTDPHSRRQPTWARRGSRFSTPEADNLSWPITPSGHINDHSPGNSSYVSSDLSSPVTPATTIDDVYAPSACGPAMPPPPLHGTPPDIVMQHPGASSEGSWAGHHVAPYAGSYNPNIQTYFPPVPQQYHPEMVHNTGNFDMQDLPTPPLVHATLAAMPQQVSYTTPAPMTAPQSLPAQSGPVPAVSEPQPQVPQQPMLGSAYTAPSPVAIMQHISSSDYIPQNAVPHVQQPQQTSLAPSQRASPPAVGTMQVDARGVTEHAAHLAPGPDAAHHAANVAYASPPQGPNTPADRPVPASRAHKKPAQDEDEERFTFGESFVTATALLFEEEVLPAYPGFPSKGSTLDTGGREKDLPSELPASEAGELYATRHKPTAHQLPTANYPANMSAMSSYPAPPSAPYATNGATATSMAAMSSSYNVPAYNYSMNTMNTMSYNSSLTGWAGS